MLRLALLLVAFGLIAACDTTAPAGPPVDPPPVPTVPPPPDPEPPPSNVTTFNWNAASQRSLWETVVGFTEGGESRRLVGGQLSLTGSTAEMTLVSRPAFNPESEPPDTFVVSGTMTLEGSVGTWTLPDERILYIAFGPTAQNATTVVVSDPSFQLGYGSIPAFRFVRPGASPTDQTSRGTLSRRLIVSEVWLAHPHPAPIWRPFPFTIYYNSINIITYTGGEINLWPEGSFTARVFLDAGTGINQISGSYAVFGDLVLLRPMHPAMAVLRQETEGTWQVGALTHPNSYSSLWVGSPTRLVAE